MHTVELMEQALVAAAELGYRVRQESMGGLGGGHCEIAGKKWLFLDLAATSQEQLRQVLDALREDPAIATAHVSRELAFALDIRRAA